MHDETAIRRAWEARDIDRATTLTIETLGPEVLGYVVGILGDPDRADDVFSLFCERLWAGFPEFAWKSSVRTWAYVIARRACVDAARGAGRDRRKTPLSEVSAISAIAARVRTETEPYLQTAQKSAFAKLRDELPEDDRALLVLRVDRQLAWEELARVFLDGDPGDGDVRREAARLRKRFQLVKDRLRERGRALGLVGGDP